MTYDFDEHVGHVSNVTHGMLTPCHAASVTYDFDERVGHVSNVTRGMLTLRIRECGLAH